MLDQVMRFITGWNDLTLTQTVLWGLAIGSTAVFFVLLFMSLLGFDFESDGDLDGGEGGFFAFLSLRNITAFFLGLSWTSLMLLDYGWSTLASVAGGTVVGVGLGAIVVVFMRAFTKLSSSGNIVLDNAIGVEGSVAIIIPAHRRGYGKISLAIQGRLVEREAVTDSDVELRRHTRVRVVDISGHQLVVSPLHPQQS